MNQISLIDLANKQPMEPLLEKEVQMRAYELYEQRGKGQGFALEDWLEAEAEILARFSNPCLRLFHSEVVMHMAFPTCSNWKILYRDALQETNKAILPQRVSEAEEAVKARGREIFYEGGTPEAEREVEALEDALYTLRSFRTAWQHSEAVGSRT